MGDRWQGADSVPRLGGDESANLAVSGVTALPTRLDRGRALRVSESMIAAQAALTRARRIVTPDGR
jgi:hypothetical protein